MRAFLLAPLLAPGLAAAQSVVIDMTGMQLRHAVNQSHSSSANPVPPGTPQTLPAAAGYTYSIDCQVRGTAGLMQTLFPSPTPLGQVLDYFQAGQSRLLRGYVRNTPGSIPATVYSQTFDGNLSGLGHVVFTMTTRLDAAGVGYIEITNVSLPLGGLIVGRAEVTSGTTTISTWTPTPPVQTEWHFEGNLDAVAGSGPARLRYLDDPAFGPPLRGTTQDPTLPTGVTRAQSSFGTTAQFGIAPIAGRVATVYKTSPTRNLSDPTNTDKCRPIGLALWPDTRYFFPEDKIGQWTIIYDLLVPSSAWGVEFPAALLQDSDTNKDDADMFIQRDSSLGVGIGYTAPLTGYVRTPLLQPDVWMRIALVSDGYQSGQGRLFINGTFIGTTGGNWLYNALDRTSPRYGDGTPVAAADWQAWAQFPSPWALSPGGVGTQTIFELFADDSGDGESVFIKSLYFTDQTLSNSQIAALGAPSADGIVLGCYANCDGSTAAPVLNVSDFVCFQGLFAAGDPRANCDGSTSAPVLNVSDFICFQGRFAAGCP